MKRRALAIGLLVLAACPVPAPKSDAGAGGSGGAGGGDGGGTGGGGGGGGGADAGCTEAWSCDRWEVDAGVGRRTCVDTNACGTTALKPPTGPTGLPALDFSYYRCEVQPVLDRTCGVLGCHGTETGRTFRVYARGRLRHSEPALDCDGGTVDLAAAGTATLRCAGASPLTPTEWQQNFDGARAFAIGVPVLADVPLLAEPLSGNTRTHGGHKPFTPTHPAYLTIKNWLGGTAAPPTCDAGFN